MAFFYDECDLTHEYERRVMWGRKSKSEVSSSGVVATSWPPAQLSSSYFSLLVTFVFVTSIIDCLQLLSLLSNSAVTAMAWSSLKPFDTTVVTVAWQRWPWPVAVCLRLSMSCWKVNITLPLIPHSLCGQSNKQVLHYLLHYLLILQLCEL